MYHNREQFRNRQGNCNQIARARDRTPNLPPNNSSLNLYFCQSSTERFRDHFFTEDLTEPAVALLNYVESSKLCSSLF